MEENTGRAEVLRIAYRMEKHVEGGSFSEMYTAPSGQDGRPLAGSIYYLLGTGEVSRFHRIDCDEIWYYHEGCGMKLTVLDGDGKRVFRLGRNVSEGERAAVMIPAGCIFAAENLQADGFTFVSCVTVPKFEESGYRLIGRNEILEKYPQYFGEIGYLAW